MHPQLEQLAHQAHVADLRHEADLQRGRRRLLRGRREGGQARSHVLSPSIRRVLVFADHPPSERQLQQALAQLAGLRGSTVVALMHHRPVQDQLAVGIVGNESGSHSLTLPTAGPRIPAQRRPSEAEQILDDVVSVFRAAGHDTQGELVAGPLSGSVMSEVRERQPEAVILLTDRHRLARLARRDLEQRLRHQTSAPVIAVTD